MSNVVTFPQMSEEDAKFAFGKTKTFDYWNDNLGLKSIRLSNLMTQNEYFKSMQGSRGSKPIDFNVVEQICASLYRHGIMKTEELPVVVSHPTKEDWYIVVEGNNRVTAFNKFANDNHLDESKIRIFALLVSVKEEFDFDTAISSLGNQYNYDRPATVTNQPKVDAISLGKRWIKSGTISYNTPKRTVEDMLCNVQGFTFANQAVLTSVLDSILDKDYSDDSIITLKTDDAKRIAEMFVEIHHSKKRVGRELQTLYGTNPAEDNAMDAWSTYLKFRNDPSFDSCSFAIWGSHNGKLELHIQRERWFNAFYERYVDTLAFNGSDPLSMEDFYSWVLTDENFNLDIWLYSQDKDNDEHAQTGNTRRVMWNGTPFTIMRLLPEDIFESILVMSEEAKKAKAEKKAAKKAGKKAFKK